MRGALALAVKGAGKVAPNPMVGAVIVDGGGVVIGQGYHQRFGYNHAEVNAIADCRKRGNDTIGAVMFVTLEPCCHHGKTGPCTQAILQAGISHVEIATLDDNPLVSGKGQQWLNTQGITTTVGCCCCQARLLNTGFFKLQRDGIPAVTLKWAQSIDGKLGWPVELHRRWITNKQSRSHVHLLRSRCGAILVGIGTVLADDPMLNVRLDGDFAQPVRVVLDSRLRLPLDCQLARTAKESPVLLCTLPDVAKAEKADLLRELGCEVIAIGRHERQIDLIAILNELGNRGITDLLVEGGPEVLRSFLRGNLADRLMVYIGDVFIGQGGIKGDGDLPCFAEAFEKLKDVQTQRFGSDVLLEAWL